MSDHIFQKKGESTWYVRLAIPADVQKAFSGRKVLIQSLKTGLRSEAMVRRLQCLSTWKQQIADARAGRALPENWQDDVIDQLQQLDELARNQKRRVIGEEVTLPAHDPEFIRVMLAIPGATEFFTKLAKSQTKDGMEGEIQITETINKIVKEMVPLKLERNYTLTNEQRNELSAIVIAPATYKPRSPITPKKLVAFRTWYSNQGKAPKTVDILIRKIEMFSAWLNQTGSTLSFDTVSTYLDALADTNGNALTSKTKRQHIWACNTFWKWAKKYDADWRERFKSTQNPFEDHDLPIIKGESIIYDAFTRSQAEMLHAKALEKSDQILANLIAIAAYTGCRLEEIGHIRRDNCTLVNGLPTSFNIPDAKTRAGIREVPVHPKLAPLMTALLAASTDGFVLPGRALDESNKYDHRLDAVGKRFGRLKKANNFGRAHVFHSVRKTAITLVHQAGARMEIMAALFGHETGLITLDIYSSGPSMEQKRQVIELLDYDFDLHQNK